MSAARVLREDAREENGPSNVATLTTVLTIPQVAKIAGWRPERMRRHLEAVNEQLGGMLLRNVSRGKHRPRWTITLRALQAIAPEWFIDAESIHRQLEHLRDEHVDLKARVAHVEKVQTLLSDQIVSIVDLIEARRKS